MLDQKFRIVTLSGKEKWIQAVSHPTPQADGSIVWDGIMLDIDGRKKSEDELQRALETNQAVLNALPDVILKIGRDGIYRSIIPKNDVFLLAPPEQVIGKHLNEVLPAEIAQERMTIIEEAFCTGKTQIQEYSLWVEGKQHYEEIRCVVCSEDEVLLLVRDITESTRNKAALQQSEERLRMAISAANQGIYDFNLQTGESTVSLEYALMLGYEPEELKESYDRWLENLHPEDQERVERTFRQYVAGEIPEYKAEFRLRTKPGEWLWILSIGQIVQWDESGKPLRMLGSHTDINKLKQTESSLKARARQQSAIAQLGQEALAATDLSVPVYFDLTSCRLNLK